MEEEFEVIPSVEDDVVYCQSDIVPTDLVPEEFELVYGSNWDQMSDVQSCPSTSSLDSPRQQQQIPMQYSAAVNQSYASQPEQPPSPAIKTEIKSEAPESPVYQSPPVKREPSDEEEEEVPQQSDLFPDVNNMSDPSAYLDSLAKGKSEDIDIYRNMLKCHGALTPELEKKLRHLSRLVKNRESAQTSRKRKREYVELLRNAIVKMRGVDSSLRSVLNAAQAEAAEKKAEAERWQSYAHDLQKLLKEHGIEAPSEPSPSTLSVVPSSSSLPVLSFSESVDDVIPESLFDGPCGFGHMAPPKGATATTKTQRKKRTPRTAEKRQKH